MKTVGTHAPITYRDQVVYPYCRSPVCVSVRCASPYSGVGGAQSSQLRVRVERVTHDAIDPVDR